MKSHEKIAMLQAWHQWHNSLSEDEIPKVSNAFKKGFKAALAIKKEPAWNTVTDWCNAFGYTQDVFTEKVWEAARK